MSSWHIIDANGLHPAPDKLKAVKNAPNPQNVTELKAYLGLLTYFYPIWLQLYHHFTDYCVTMLSGNGPLQRQKHFRNPKIY